MRRLSRLPAPVIYAGALVWTKGLAMLAVPMLTSHLSPDEFGRLELLASAAEIGGVIVGAGLVDTLYRFAIGDQAKAQAARVMGLALAIALACFALLALTAPTIAAAMPLQTAPHEVLMLGAAVVLEGVIGVPLGWLRMNGRAQAYTLLISARATLQVGLLALLLVMDAGVTGVLTAGLVAGLLLAGVLTAGQMRQSGLQFSPRGSAALLTYGLPLVGGGLAAFILGTADRWWLAGSVTAAALGHYGLALKIGQIVNLLAQPFELWWYPRRLMVLSGPNGRARSSEVVMAGMSLLIVAAGAVSLAAPLIVALLAPPAYAPAAALVPPLALVMVLHLGSSMANVGIYARDTGWLALAINSGAALVAVTCYSLLIPRFGVEGAIAATIIAQVARFIAMALLSQRTAPLDWKLGRLAMLAAAAVAAVVIGGGAGSLLLAGAAAGALASGLIQMPRRLSVVQAA
ncbi:MAG: oligosaccharide flippase family protein [Alphaproteobacteria bacterium]|nr:oligosaccharide flippase family protein [Alphaproteobacteria bacterium]